MGLAWFHAVSHGDPTLVVSLSDVDEERFGKKQQTRRRAGVITNKDRFGQPSGDGGLTRKRTDGRGSRG